MKHDGLDFSLPSHRENQTRYLKWRSGQRGPTWVKPTHRASRSHDVSGASDKVPPISHDDAVVRHQLVHTVQDFQGIQVVLRLLISFSPGTQKAAGLTPHVDRTSVLVSGDLLEL